MADDEDFEGLTEEDLNQLASEMDETSLRPRPTSKPPSASPSTARKSTGTYDPNKLQNFLKEQAQNTPDIKEKVPYGSSPVRTPSKYSSASSSSSSTPVSKAPSAKPAAASDRKLDADDELLAALTGQSEEDILKMVSEMEEEDKSRGRTIVTASLSSPSSVVKATTLDKPRDDGVNLVDLTDALKRLQTNDASLTTLNLNNHPEMNVDYSLAFAKALAGNTHLTDLRMANTRVNDAVVHELIQSLKDNATLQTLNLETNEISGKALKQLVASIVTNKTLIELKLTNQANSVGDMYETDISRLIDGNNTIRKLSLTTRSIAARNAIERVCSRNSEAARKSRLAANAGKK